MSEWGEGGLMGITFHPDFPSRPYVYAAHSHLQSGALRNRLVRMRWDGQSLDNATIAASSAVDRDVVSGIAASQR